MWNKLIKEWWKDLTDARKFFFSVFTRSQKPVSVDLKNPDLLSGDLFVKV